MDLPTSYNRADDSWPRSQAPAFATTVLCMLREAEGKDSYKHGLFMCHKAYRIDLLCEQCYVASSYRADFYLSRTSEPN